MMMIRLLLFFQFSSFITIIISFLISFITKSKVRKIWKNDETFEQITKTFLTKVNNSKKYEIIEK